MEGQISTAGESTTRGRPQLTLKDKPRKARPERDESAEERKQQKKEKRKRSEKRSKEKGRSSRSGPATERSRSDPAKRWERRRPPMPPPADPPLKKIPNRAKLLAMPPPPRPGSSTETTQREQAQLRPLKSSLSTGKGTRGSNRPQEPDNPPQRAMPRQRDSPTGRPAHEQPLATPRRQTAAEHQITIPQQRDERSSRWQEYSGGRWESREHEDRSRSSRQWSEGQRWTEHSRQDWSSHQGWKSRSSYADGGSQRQWQGQRQEWNQPTQEQQWGY